MTVCIQRVEALKKIEHAFDVAVLPSQYTTLNTLTHEQIV